jgi:hypothetical protein
VPVVLALNVQNGLVPVLKYHVFGVYETFTTPTPVLVLFLCTYIMYMLRFV